MYELKNLKAVILVTDFNNSVIVNEISENVQFKADIKHYCGCVDDIFCELELPTKSGFYEFNGGATVGTDIYGNIDTCYYGDFTELKSYAFNSR